MYQYGEGNQMIREGDPGRFTVWAKSGGVRELYRVCRTKEEARETTEQYEAAGYEVEIIERVAGTTAERIWRPDPRLQFRKVAPKR